MRLDKFLKVSRIIKRRTLAKEVCDSDRVNINGKPAKASSTVAVNDLIQIRFGQKLVTFRVDALKETSRKEEADSMYTTVEEKPID
jgi:ribosomal 50S subunit-recycling heat shock protein